MSTTVNVFIYDLLLALGILCAFGVCGLGVLLSIFRADGLQVYAAPFIGLLIVPFGANILYSVLGMDYSQAAAFSAASCMVLTVLQWRRPLFGLLPNVGSIGCSLLVAASITALSLLINNASSLYAGGPAIFFYDGSDHGGYAQLADWLGSHTIRNMPTASPDKPYESWPALMFLADPRFGSFGLLEIISGIRGTSAIFSYDFACAVVLAAGSLGVAAIFSRSSLILVLLTIGLLGSHWYDYAHGGYFGKIIGYPAALFLVGMIWKALPGVTIERVVALALVAAAVGTMHSGVGAAFLMTPILATSIAALAIWKHDDISVSKAILLCGVVCSAPIIASGLSARPLALGYPDWFLSWIYIWPRLLDLENQGVVLSGLPTSWLVANCILALTIWAVLLAVALLTRKYVAIGLLGGPAILLAVLWISGASAVAFQLIGYFYPAALCGACALVADVPRRTMQLLGLVVLMIAQHLPRSIGAIDRYALHQDKRFLFTAQEIERLADEIDSQAVEIDVPDVLPAIILLVELGRRNLDLQFSERAWNVLFRYRGWAPPNYIESAPLKVQQINPGLSEHFRIEKTR